MSTRSDKNGLSDRITVTIGPKGDHETLDDFMSCLRSNDNTEEEHGIPLELVDVEVATDRGAVKISNLQIHEAMLKVAK